ncbi:MAG: hypothetical protein A2X59_03915 [Nitrospirae bacterium GWC2_42_7]|nr:MAG: hypothetical protein A2X59_03915 [Nitrospirae bacterium GWC2_42_7]
MKKSKLLLIAVCIISVIVYAYWKLAIPTHRTDIQSELVMLGDMDNDNRWTANDLKLIDAFLKDPFTASGDFRWRLDLNKNGLIDQEDLDILRALVDSNGDPYVAEEKAQARKVAFPRPRELYRYISDTEYRTQPLWALSYPMAKDSVLEWFFNSQQPINTTYYKGKLNAAVYSEAVRFDQAWHKRQPKLLPIELDYANQKLLMAKELYESGEQYELLLALTELVEDAETLTVRDSPEITLKILTFRDHLRKVLCSALFADVEEGKKDWHAVLKQVSVYIKSDLGLDYDFETLGPPRNLTNLENYLQRAEWQYYKSTARDEDFRALVNYAQHDPRYLAAVSRTNPRHQDLQVENQNLPMVLLFREALRIKHGDKKKAVGLLDEAIRIPYGWIKSISRSSLPDSVALENFLLPGNKEDGADKSRHWNVFGGLCLYKTPEEAIDLALKREMQDLRNENYTVDALREFLRDMIANLNGMYHVMVINPNLLQSEQTL